MKLKIIFLCIMFAQTSASFFDEFRGAMSSVENSFGKLLSDVVTDVRETIGCTILAVKQVLTLGGGYSESSDYDKRCGGDEKGKAASTFDSAKGPVIPPLTFRSMSNEKPLSEQVLEKIDESVSYVHNTMFDLIDKSGAYKNIVKAKANIVHERDRLSEISDLLRRELSNISDEVKRELSKAELNLNHQTVEGIKKDIRALHKIELSHRNTPEATEIHHILNDILSVLHGDVIQHETSVSQLETSTDNPSNDPFSEIEDQFEKIEQEKDGTNNFDDSDAVDTGKSDSVQNADFPSTSKNDESQIMDETSRTFRFADGSSQYYEHVVTTTTEAPVITEKYVDYSEISPDYNSLFQLAHKDSPAHKEAIHEAKKLFEKSKETDAIMNDYFKNADNVGTSVFDNPDLFEEFA